MSGPNPKLSHFDDDEPSILEAWDRTLDLFVANVRSFPKTADEIRDFADARFARRDDDDRLVVISLRTATRWPTTSFAHAGASGVYRLLMGKAVGDAVFTDLADYLSSDPLEPVYSLLPVSFPQGSFTQALGQPEDYPDPPVIPSVFEYPDEEVTVTAGLAMLLKDTWASVHDYTISWMAIWGCTVQVVAYLMGGFDAELKAVTALVVIYVAVKALSNLRAGEFGLAFWRLLHFPLWMTLVAVGTLGDSLHAGGFVPLRQGCIVFVTIWCLGGSVQTILLLLGLQRVDELRKDLKRAARKFFEDEE